MAIDIGPKIGIDGEAEFRKSLQNINQQLKTLGSEMNLVTTAFGENNKSQDALTSKAAVLTKQIDAQQKKIEELQKGLAMSASKFGENDAKTLKWEQAIYDATAELNSMKGQLESTNQEIENNKDAVDKSSKSTGAWKENLANIGKALGTIGSMATKAIGAATGAITTFAAKSVQAGMSFDSSMSQVAATMGTTVDQISDLRDFAMDMGASTAFSATEAADALNYMALAGYNSEEAMTALPTVLNLAASGGIDLASASDMVTDAQSALGLSMEESAELVDKMAKTASKSNTSVSQLGSAILTIGGTAKNLAGGTTELATALGILADNGVKGAEGGTALRNIVLSLSAPTEKAAAVMASLGVSAYDSFGNLRPLEDTFTDLNNSLSQLTQEEQTNALNNIFNKVDLKSVNALLANTGERFDELSGYIDNAAGAAQDMASVQLDNLEGDITLFKSALEGAQITISDQLTPTLRGFVQFGSDAISTLSTAFSEGGLTGAMDALGSILSDGLNMVIEQLPKMVGAGMQLLDALGQGLLDNLPVIISAANDIIMQLISGFISSLPDIAKAATEIIASLVVGIGESLPTLIPAAIDAMLTIIDTLIDNIDLLVDAAIAITVGLAEGLINALPVLIERVPEIIVKLIDAFIENAPKIAEAALELILMLGNGLLDALPNLWKNIKSIIGQIKDRFVQGFKDFINIGKNIVEGLWEGIKGAADWLGDKISGFVGGVVDGVKGFFGIHSPSTVFRDEVGKQLAAGIGLGFTDEMDTVSKQMQKAIPTPEVAFSTAAAGMVNGMQTAMTGYSGTVRIEIPVRINGKELYRYTLDDLRSVMRANPEAAT